MRRGTTPTNTFKVDIDLREAAVMYITYSQLGKTIVEKEIQDITIEEDTLSVTLTQEETLAFCAGEVEVQIRARFPGGLAVESEIKKTTAERVLKEGVI